MTKNTPAPECPDLWPHVSVLHAPGNQLHGQVVVSTRTMGLLMAPSVPEFLDWWKENGERVNEGIKAGRLEFPEHWQRWARGRSSELRARYGASCLVGVLRGLHREYGVLPQGGDL